MKVHDTKRHMILVIDADIRYADRLLELQNLMPNLIVTAYSHIGGFEYHVRLRDLALDLASVQRLNR